MPHYSEKRENPERHSDGVRKFEKNHPWKTGESVYQHDSNDVTLDVDKPEKKG